MEENTELGAVEGYQRDSVEEDVDDAGTDGYWSDSVEEDVDDAGSDGNGWVATVDDLTKSMKDELASKPYKPAYKATILRVPDEMRNDDPGAYIPKEVSIGPFHRLRQNVQHMEELKWHYLGKFLGRQPENDLQMYVQKMKEIEERARSCYEGNIEMESEEFVKMMVLDGCFIIQLLLQLEDDDLFYEREDPIYRVIWTLPRVAHDMLLLENQLPFCVLERLWMLTGRPVYELGSSVLNFFCNILPEEHDHKPPAIEVHHILHLLHSSLIATPDPSKDGPHGSPVKPLEMVVIDRQDRPRPHPVEKIDPHDRRPSPVSKPEPPQPKLMAEILPQDRRPSPVSKPEPPQGRHMAGILPQDRQPSPVSKPEQPARRIVLQSLLLPHDRCGRPLSLKRRPSPVSKPEPPQGRPMAGILPQDRRPPPMSKHKPPPPPPKTIPTVTELQEAGVKFKRKKAKSFLEIKFKQGLMEIPRLTISDSTNSLFRNFIAFEQCLPWSSAHFTSYCIFMDSLINTPRDVQLLYQSDIIEHVLGSDKEVAILFNKLCKGITWDFKNSYLANVSEGVIQHSQLKWPKWRAKLVRDYFSNPWAILSLAAAIFVIILASGQTFFAFFAYFRPPRS